MDTNHKHGWSTAEIDEQESSNFSWNTFLFAIAITLIIVNWGFLRPAARQLETMKRQVYSLEKTIAKLAQQHGAAYKSMNLLDVLSQQAKVNDQAAESLARIADLHDRVVAESDELDFAHDAFAQFTNLRDALKKNTNLIASATHGLSQVNDLHEEVVSVAVKTGEAETALRRLDSLSQEFVAAAAKMDSSQPLLSKVDQLQRKISDMEPITECADAVADNLILLNERLAYECSTVGDASDTLDELVGIREKIDIAATNMTESEETLENLVRLKDHVMKQSDDIPLAIETLEQTVDLHDQFIQAKRSFTEIRRWMGDVILMEPTISRAMQSLEPLTSLGSLRRISRQELQQAANMVKAMRRSQLSNAEERTEVATKPEQPASAVH